MSAVYEATMLLASGRGPGEYMGVWPWLWVMLKIVFTIAVVWLLLRYFRPRRPSGTDRAKDVLAERYARGELTIDEYRERLGHLQ
jgi:putative membrane protein